MDTLWPLVEEELSRSLSYSPLWTLESIKEKCKGREMQLWLGFLDGALVGVVVTQIEVYPLGKVCNLFALAGRRMELWKDQLKLIENWASRAGCIQIRAQMRKGVERVFRQNGALDDFRETHTLIEKDI